MRANETYSEAKHQYSDRNRTVLMNVQSPHKWWSTHKSAVSGTSSSLLLLVNEVGGLVCESVGKTDLLSDHFDSKHSREAVDLPLTCHPSHSLPPLPACRERSGISCWTWTLIVALTHWVCFLFFLGELMLLPLILMYFGGMFVWVVSCLAGDRPLSPQFRKVHLRPLLPITDRFP